MITKLCVAVVLTVLGVSILTPRSDRLVVAAQADVDALVEQLRDLPTPLQAGGKPTPLELRRREVYRALLERGNSVLPALERGLRDPDVAMRRSVAATLNVLALGYFYADGQHKLDILPSLSVLIGALQDEDSYVRAWTAQAIGTIGPAAAPAVPALIALLVNGDEGAHISACIGLRGIGPAAKDALPALRQALSDPSEDLRRFAQLAIERIER
jgi:HEAT repeat protein